jgi:hypothetical protein
MKVEVFTLCDAATDQRGKLNILGSFDLICSKEESIVHAACAIAVRVRFFKVEEGEHSLKLAITDQDGLLIVPPINGDFSIGMAPDAVSYAQNLIFNLQALEFPHFGDYSINLHIDNKLIDSLPVYLRPIR